MTVRVVTPPGPIVSVEDAKKHLRVRHNDDDDVISSFIASATEWIDGPAGWLGRSLGVQMLEARGAFASECMRLDYPPVLEVESITYEGEDGDRETADPSTYDLDGDVLVVQSGASWVTQPDHRIRYWAGYGRRDPDDATKWINEPPSPVSAAILMLVAQWYGTRSNVVVGSAPAVMPFAVDALLSPFRLFR